ESGAYQIFVQAFPSGGKWQVSRNGGIQPRWRGDGKELFFISYESNAVMAVDIRAGAAIESGIPSKLFDAVVPQRKAASAMPSQPMDKNSSSPPKHALASPSPSPRS